MSFQLIFIINFNQTQCRPYLSISCTVTDDCTDSHPRCSSWASSGECSANPSYMHQYCKKSCHKCPGEEEEVITRKSKILLFLFGFALCKISITAQEISADLEWRAAIWQYNVQYFPYGKLNFFPILCM